MSNETVVKLSLIAAIALDMANKLEHRQTWPGDLSDAIQKIRETLAEIREPQ